MSSFSRAQITTTRELRWFFAEPPAAFTAWRGEEQRRVDYYAPLCDGRLGVKLREGRLEVKVLLGEEPVGATSLPDLNHQLWRKTSQPVDEAGVDALEAWAAEFWLPVRKRRWVRSFQRRGGHFMESNSAGSANAAAAEWAEVRLHDRVAWTFCVEADAELPRNACGQVVQRSLAALQVDVARFPRPQSYGAWIATWAAGFPAPASGLK